MRILVTGGAGFIGSHLCEKLLEAGHAVVAIDNFITGSSKNLAAFKDHANFTLLQHDINLPLPAAIIGKTNMAPGYGEQDSLKFDQIFHLACPASPVDFAEIPLQVLQTCSTGSKNIIEVAVRHGAVFLLASSSDVYGQHEALNERNCYAEGKRFAETLAVNYFHHYGFPLKIVRISETYGPRMRKHDGRVISSFIRAALSDEPLRLNADDSEIRMFCFVDDVVEGLLEAMNRQEPFDKIGPVDFAIGEKISFRKLAGKIVQACGSSSLISPAGALDEGLKSTIAYFKS